MISKSEKTILMAVYIIIAKDDDDAAVWLFTSKRIRIVKMVLII